DGAPTVDEKFPSYAPGDTNSNGRLDEIAKEIYEQDILPDVGTGTTYSKQYITTYTIGFKSDQTLLENTADWGGGEYYTASNATQLSEAFETILSNISSSNTTFTSPSVPVSCFHQRGRIRCR
ncbi:MAG: hypothetical protein R6V15_08400, partial [Desulfotignum sp.]